MGSKDRPEKDANAEREAKLAQALRANLRRRKAAVAAHDPKPDKADERS